MKCLTRWTMPLALALTMSVVFVSSQAMAGIIDFTAGTPDPRTGGPFTIGYEFTVGSSDIVIDALGVHDYSAAGAATDGFPFLFVPEVGIWDTTSTTPLRSVVMQANLGSTLDADGYRYEPVANLTLFANTTYIIGAVVGGNTEFFEDTGTFIGNGITINQSNFNSGSTLTRPDNNGGAAGRWGAANARVVPIPEPTSLMLVGLGAISLVGFGRRRK